MSFARHCCVNINNHCRLTISDEDKVFIEVLRQERVMGRKKFIKEFTNKNWPLSSVKKLLTKIDQMVLWIANPAVVKSVWCGFLRTLIQFRSWC